MNTPRTTAASQTRRRAPTRLALAAAAVAVIATLVPDGTAQASAPRSAPVPISAPAAVSTANGAHDRSVPRVVSEWEAAWNTGDGDRMTALFTKDGVYEDFSLGLRFTGRAEINQFVANSGRFVTGLHVDVTDAFRTGDRVGVRFVFSGQLNDAPHAFSIPVFTVMELKGNKIAYNGDYYNRLEVLRQSGLPTS